jgi:hypothetical protein
MRGTFQGVWLRDGFALLVHPPGSEKPVLIGLNLLELQGLSKEITDYLTDRIRLLESEKAGVPVSAREIT